MLYMVIAFLIIAVLFEKLCDKLKRGSLIDQERHYLKEREKYFLYDKHGNLKKITH